MFSITFLAQKLATAQADKAKEDSAMAMNSASSGLRVLLAEDSLDNRYLIEHILRRAGMQVEVASNGEEALRFALKNNYDLVLMDIQMPIMDGLEATRSLRNAGFRKPIIALTAHAMVEERARTRAAGCDGHLTKPLNVKELLKTVTAFATH